MIIVASDLLIGVFSVTQVTQWIQRRARMMASKKGRQSLQAMRKKMITSNNAMYHSQRFKGLPPHTTSLPYTLKRMSWIRL